MPSSSVRCSAEGLAEGKGAAAIFLSWSLATDGAGESLLPPSISRSRGYEVLYAPTHTTQGEDEVFYSLSFHVASSV